MRPLKNPREENGYPKDNPAFDAACKKVLKARKKDIEQAERFLKKLATALAAEHERSDKLHDEELFV